MKRRTTRSDVPASVYSCAFMASTICSRSAILAKAGIAVENLKRRIDQAAKYAPLDQLCMSGQCGFASTEEGNLLTEEEQWAKLRRIVEVADEVWG